MSQNVAAQTAGVIAAPDSSLTHTPLAQSITELAMPGVLICPKCGSLLAVIENKQLLFCPWEFDGAAEMDCGDSLCATEGLWSANSHLY